MKKFVFLMTVFILDIFLINVIFNNVTKQQIKNQKLSKTESINLADYYTAKGKSNNVLGVTSSTDSASVTFGELLITSSPQPIQVSPTPKNNKTIPKPSPIFEKLTINNNSLTIALLGDSMIDTLGPNLDDLKNSLRNSFPATSLHLYNFGVGASDMESGLTRLTNSYSYLGQTKSSVLAVNPDILVIESFAYNHWNNTKSDLDRHWLTIAKIIDTVNDLSPKTKIILASTIAPYCPTYTDGSANIQEPEKWIQCQTVIAYLQNMVNFATSQKYPLADAYHPSLTNGQGNPKYINSGDHIHTSEEGRILFSQKVAETISKIMN